MNNQHNLKEVLNQIEELKTLVIQLTEKLNIEHRQSTYNVQPLDVDVALTRQLFEQMVYECGRHIPMLKSIYPIHDAIISGVDIVVTAKAYGLLNNRMRRMSHLDDNDNVTGEMISIPDKDKIYIILYDVDKRTRPSTKSITHAGTIVSMGRNVNKLITSNGEYDEIITKAFNSLKLTIGETL